MPAIAPESPDSSLPPSRLTAGALVHLAEWTTSHCPRAARQAALCLETLASRCDGDAHLAAACATWLAALDTEHPR